MNRVKKIEKKREKLETKLFSDLGKYLDKIELIKNEIRELESGVERDSLELDIEGNLASRIKEIRGFLRSR